MVRAKYGRGVIKSFDKTIYSWNFKIQMQIHSKQINTNLPVWTLTAKRMN
jgi:hypothetical protein